MNREEREEKARINICACYYYDLVDNMDEATDEELDEIIADGRHVHTVMGEKRSDCVEEIEQRILDARKELS